MQLSFYHFALAFMAGLFGTMIMDLIKYFGHKAHLIGGVKMEILGRWSLGMTKGQFFYVDIHASPEIENEVLAGWIFHYLTGGLIALVFPLLLLSLSMPSIESIFYYAFLFGLTTSVLPWLVVYPAFGKGWFGHKAAAASKPILTSLVSHTFYGAGIGIFYIGGL